MLLQQLNRSDAEKVFIIVQNATTAATQGAALCFDARTTSSLGNAVLQPQTSNLGAFAGILDANLAADAFGLCQVYGYRASIACSIPGASISAAGLILGPVTGLWSLTSNGRSFGLGPVVVLENDVSDPGWVKGFIRAL